MPRHTCPLTARPFATRLPASTMAACALSICCALATPAASAEGSTPVYVFGDSLSDTGNLAEKAYWRNFPNPPSYHDSFTNGPVAMELLAEGFGGRADPSLFPDGFVDVHHLFGPGYVPGTNYAVAGATATDRGIVFLDMDLPHQVSAFIAHMGGPGHAPANAIYAMLIGGNDVRDAAHALSVLPVITGVRSELAQLQALIGAGAQHLLVSGVPDVGIIPEFTGGPADEDKAAHDYSLLYNHELTAGIDTLRAAYPNVTITYFDLFNFAGAVFNHAASFGFTNTTDACYTSSVTTTPVTTSPGCGPVTPTGAAHIDEFFFWDDIHPTARVHALLAKGLIAAALRP